MTLSYPFHNVRIVSLVSMCFEARATNERSSLGDQGRSIAENVTVLLFQGTMLLVFNVGSVTQKNKMLHVQIEIFLVS